MTVAFAKVSPEEAKEQARGRLVEVLAEIVPGFRPERAFRCLSPGHEDRHPSMRYLSRTNKVKCFSCGWTGDVFDVAGAAYGLTGGAAFAKVYEMLGLDPKSGKPRQVKPRGSAKPLPPKESALSAEWIEYFRSLIYPPGWDAAVEIKLPLPLEVMANAEIGLIGQLLLHPVAADVCVACGLERWHFDDAELGELYGDICAGAALDDYNEEFFVWLKERAKPAHMVRRLAKFIVAEGQKRKLEAAFVAASFSLQNLEPPDMVVEDILNQAELALNCRFDMPALDDAAMHELLVEMIRRFHDGDDAVSIVERFRRVDQPGAPI